jgi:V/A-type H+/Na+-transporting ATPase subunit A
MNDEQPGRIIRIAGPAVVAEKMESAKLDDIVWVGEPRLLGEVIRVEQDQAFLQVFEDTTGLAVGEPVVNTHAPLSVSLGPGLLGQIYDGVQRPLVALREAHGAFLSRGVSANPLDLAKRWPFEPRVHSGMRVVPGAILGVVEEQQGRAHPIVVPPGMEEGEVDEVFAGPRTVEEPVVRLRDGRELTMLQRWPVKRGRPYKLKMDPSDPFLTGQRVLDALFPICLGGTAIIPGGFGTGKTVLEQTLAKCSNAQIIVYVGCGERGNEMTDVLTEFPKLTDPFTGRPMMERTVLIANTSNMPVAAREASVYVGLTIAEYYRDMGYHVALLADSTSRWAEAMREISSRLEEMPGEEGYPTYLASRLAGFYERSGKVRCLGDEERVGSVTIVGAVSPPGGDYSEPVTQNSQRVAGALWALDAPLAYRRHFPAIGWLRSYSLYSRQLEAWYTRELSADWLDLVQSVRALLQRDAELQEVVQLVGPEGLQDQERVILETGRAIRDGFLQQNALSPVDLRCSLPKQKAMMQAILHFHRLAIEAVKKGIAAEKLAALPQREALTRMKEVPEEQVKTYLEHFTHELETTISQLA